jgi:curved DNA-binding protein
MTHYDTLGVQPGATAEAIRRAYRELAKKHHPDTGGDATRFAAIAAAYAVLSEASERRKYDVFLDEQRRAESAGHGARGAHYSWENVASPRRGGRSDASEFDDIYDTFYVKHERNTP